MLTFLRIVRLVCLAAWVGSLIFFGFVAQVAFTSLPDAHTAGIVVRGSLIALHHLGLVAGAAYLVATLLIWATRLDRHRFRLAELVLVAAMLGCTAFSQFSILPRMERDRLALGGDVAEAPEAAPARVEFDRLHAVSVKVEGAVLIGGLILLCLAAVQGSVRAGRVFSA